eukprot:scaffold2979_cov243-Pinguiococcus_pyrenoidosus.AAC.1
MDGMELLLDRFTLAAFSCVPSAAPSSAFWGGRKVFESAKGFTSTSPGADSWSRAALLATFGRPSLSSGIVAQSLIAETELTHPRRSLFFTYFAFGPAP